VHQVGHRLDLPQNVSLFEWYAFSHFKNQGCLIFYFTPYRQIYILLVTKCFHVSIRTNKIILMLKRGEKLKNGNTICLIWNYIVSIEEEMYIAGERVSLCEDIHKHTNTNTARCVSLA